MPSVETEYEAIVRADPCAYCGSAGGSADHIRPRITWGRAAGLYRRFAQKTPTQEWSAWDNLTGSCLDCNSRKGPKPLLHYMLWRSRPIETSD